MRIAIKSGGQAAMQEWRDLFRTLAPHLEVSGWEDADLDPHDVDYVLVWEPTHGRLAQMPNLKLIISSGAGVDHILADKRLPAHVPIARMVTEDNASAMSEFVLASVLIVVKQMKTVLENQLQKRWVTPPPPRAAADVRVGVMGLGRLGSATARLLQRVGFQVNGWARSKTTIEAVHTFSGAEQFDSFLSQTDILVCLLPGTEATRGILGAKTLAKLPRGASVINVGRGSHFVQADIIGALESGQLSQAVLDVFEEEPLAADSPLWTTPGVIVTPHYAATLTRPERARHAARLIAMHQNGDPLPEVYDPDRGY